MGQAGIMKAGSSQRAGLRYFQGVAASNPQDLGMVADGLGVGFDMAAGHRYSEVVQWL